MAHPRTIANISAAAFATSTAIWIAAQLVQLLFVGRAQSFDAMLYARSLWGVGHLDFFNPVLDMPTAAIHGHLVPLIVLGPLTWVFSSSAVLIFATSASFAVTAWLAGAAMAQGHVGIRAAFMGIFGAALLVLGTPLVTNPFLFDIRPDLVAVPLVTGALLIIARTGRIDRKALVLLAAGTLCREEFGLVAAAGLLLTPTQQTWRERALLGAPFAAWWAVYALLLSPLLGGTSQSMAMHAAGDGASLTAIVESKLVMVALIVCAGGGFALRGWRYAGSALPGLAILLITKWMPESQLNFHYPMFIAPGLIVATVLGHRSWCRKGGKPYAARLLVAALVAIGCFLVGSALPGGGRYFRAHFESAPVPNARDLIPATRSEGLALPYQYGAAAADRPYVTPLGPLRKTIVQNRPVSDELSHVIVEPPDWDRIGASLVSTGQWHLADRAGTSVRLSRGGSAQTNWNAVASEGRISPCKSPIARWPTLGMIACGATRLSDGRAAVTFAQIEHRNRSPQALRAVLGGATDPQRTQTPLWIMRGIAPLVDLPQGATANAVSQGPVDKSINLLTILDERGQPVFTSDSSKHVVLSWDAP